MTLSLIFACAGYFLLALVAILDKFIVSETSNTTRTYTFYSTIFFFGAFLMLPFIDPVSGVGLAPIILSGLAFGFGAWAMFVALEYGEASHILPFIGVFVSVATILLSFVFLHESLSSNMQIGLGFLVFASILLSFEKSRKHNGFHRGFLWAILSGVLFGISHVAAKYVYEIMPFITGLVWTKGTVGLVGLIILCLPGARQEIFASRPRAPGSSKKHPLIIVIDKVVSVVAVVCIQYAIAIGSVTLINALAGLQYAFMFVGIYLLTKIRPKLFSEFFTKREVVAEASAVIMIIIGLAFLI